MFGNSNLQLPPQIFYGIKVWRLARPLQDLNVLLLEPLLCCLGCVFWVIVMLENPSTTHFQCPGWLQCLALMAHDVHHPFGAVQLSCPLCRKTPQIIMSPPPCLTVCGWRSWGHRQYSSSSTYGKSSWCKKSRILVSSDHNTFTQFSSESLVIFRHAVHVLSRAAGRCVRCRISVLYGVVCYQLFS